MLLIDYVIPDFDPEDADIEELPVVARYCTADPDTVLTAEEARTALVEVFVMDMWHWANEWFDYNAEMALIARDERARLGHGARRRCGRHPLTRGGYFTGDSGS